MKPVRISDLKARLGEYLRSVRRGHSVVVLDRDTPIARIVPYERPKERLQIRKPVRRYRTLGEIPLPPPLELKIDPVELLLEERRIDH